MTLRLQIGNRGLIPNVAVRHGAIRFT